MLGKDWDHSHEDWTVKSFELGFPEGDRGATQGVLRGAEATGRGFDQVVNEASRRGEGDPTRRGDLPDSIVGLVVDV